jgi:hypothetical protein
MGQKFYNESDIQAIAAAIRGKNGTQNTYKASQMAAAITAIPTGITPTGTISITANGTYDVTDKAQAVVNVGASPSLITKAIAQNGTYNASDDQADGYASVTVAVPVGSLNSKCFVVTLNTAPATGAWYYFNAADAEIAAHINDPTFVAVIINTTDSTTLTYRTIGGVATNHKLNSYGTQNSYGVYMRTNSSGATGYVGVNKAITDTATGTGQMIVTADGRLGIYCASQYAWAAGTYVAMCGW